MSDLFQVYIEFVKEHSLISAMLHFGILGTAGELISIRIKKRGQKQTLLPYSFFKLSLVIIAWAILGIVIKYGFAGMNSFVQGLVDKQMLPAICWSDTWVRAFSISVATNIFFGPQMMFFHRLEDNLIHNRRDFTGLQNAWKTLLWFWIPAHTLTFAMPDDFRIVLAALWSLALGIILGMNASSPKS